MRVTVGSGSQQNLPASPVGVTSGDDVTISWDPLSNAVGLGREPIGYEPAGFGATLPPDVRHTIIEVFDRTTSEVIASSSQIFPPTESYLYSSSQNTTDHGSYATDFGLQVVQFDQLGRRRVIDSVEFTAA